MATAEKHSILKTIARPLIAIILLIILVKKGPFQLDQIKFILSQPKVLLLGFVLMVTNFGLAATRWKTIVNLLSKITLKTSLALTLVGHFFSFFIPGGVSGDLVKAFELSKENSISKKEALSTVFADRLLGLYAMVFFSALFLYVDYLQENTNQIFQYFSFSLVLLFVMTIGLITGPWITQFVSGKIIIQKNKILSTLNKLLSSFNLTFMCVRKPQLSLQVLLLSLGMQSFSILFMLEVVKALNVTPPTFFVFFSLSCFGFLASAIPITPAGIGVGQAAVYFLFSTLNPELGQAAVTAISVFQIFNLFFALIGGIIFSAKPFFQNKFRAN